MFSIFSSVSNDWNSRDVDLWRKSPGMVICLHGREEVQRHFHDNASFAKRHHYRN